MVSMGDRSSRVALPWRHVVFGVILAFTLTTFAAADVWDDWDYPGQKRKLKIWVGGAGNIPGFADAVKAAMANWNGQSGNPPRDNNGAWELVEGTEADHDVAVQGGGIDGAGDSLGQTDVTYDGTTGEVQGDVDITMDNKEDWGPGKDQQDLERAIKHELGHAQRMDDTAIAGDLMNGSQAAGNHNVTPSGHDQDEARASYIDNMLIDILPEKLRKNNPTYCSITGPTLDLGNAAAVSVHPLEPQQLQIGNVTWDQTAVSASFFGMQSAWHNEGFLVSVRYRDDSTREFGGFATINETDPPVGALPHAVTEQNVISWVGHTFTLHGCGSYHDDHDYTPSLVHEWRWPAGGGLAHIVQSEDLSLSYDQPGAYPFTLEVEDVFTQKSSAPVMVNVMPYPPPGMDCFDSTATLMLHDPGGATHRVSLYGPVSISREAAGDSDGDTLLDIETRIIQMSLQGKDPTLGTIGLSNFGGPAVGQIEQMSSGMSYPVSSFFDVFLEVDLPGLQLHSTSADRIMVPGGANGIPFPVGTSHESTSTMTPLFLPDGSPSGWSYSGLRLTRQSPPTPEPYTQCADGTAHLLLHNLATDQWEPIRLEGPVVIQRGPRSGGITDPWTVDTEIVSMNLTGIGPVVGPVRVVQSPDLSSTGRVTQQGVGNDFPADSFFDVFVEVQLPSYPLHNCGRIYLDGLLNELPMPVGTVHQTQPGATTQLLDSNGNPSNWQVEMFVLVLGPEPSTQPILEAYQATGSIKYQDELGIVTTTPLDGTIVIKRDNAWPPNPCNIPIEIVALSLQSVEPISPVVKVGKRDDRASTGVVTSTTPTSTFPVDSFFDVFFDVELPDGGVLTNCQLSSVRSIAPIPALPIPPGTVLRTIEPFQPYAGETLSNSQVLEIELVIGPAPTQVQTPRQAKLLPEGQTLQLIGPVVSSFFDVFFYVEATDRSSGIGVDWTGIEPVAGQTVTLVGKVNLVNGEARFNASYVEPLGWYGTIDPLFTPIPSLGGAATGLQVGVGKGVGLNNTGLYMRTSGKVYEYDAPNRVIRVQISDTDRIKVDFSHTTGPIALPNLNDYIGVTGALGAEVTPEGVKPVIYAIEYRVF